MHKIAAAGLILLAVMVSAPVDARGGHGHAALVGHGAQAGEEGAASEAARRRDEEYLKAVSEEEGRLVKKLKPICRGC
jgi:BRCT domain type II-containing protein